MIVVGTMFANKQPNSSIHGISCYKVAPTNRVQAKEIEGGGGARMKVTQMTTPILRNPAGKKRPGGYLQKSGNFGIKRVDKDQIFTVG